MTGIEELRNAFQEHAARYGPRMVYDAFVTGVDKDTFLCDLDVEDKGPVYGVRLRAVEAGNQSVDIIPSEGSAVLVIRIIDNDYFVLACDKIESYSITTGTTRLYLDANGALLSKGTDTLGKCIDDLMLLIQAIYAPKDMASFIQLQTRFKALLK